LFASGEWWKITSLSMTGEREKNYCKVKPHDATPVKKVKLIGIKYNSR
jgi:hypothetical protein